jgi:hypothetical protein
MMDLVTSVVTTKPWMRLLASLPRAAFRWNHSDVMADGGRALARQLGVRVISRRGWSAAN